MTQSRIRSWMIALAFMGASLSHGVAQDAWSSPGATPERTACDVAPRSLPDLLALLGTDAPDDDQVQEIEPLPSGVPADAATIAAITVVVRAFEACMNAGDQLRLYALFSDDQFRGIPPSMELMEEFRALADATPVAAPVGQRQVLIGPWHVELLADGRVLAAVQFRSEADLNRPDTTKAVLFVQQDGQWLLQELRDFLWVGDGADGAIMVPVADVVGPPPGP